MFEKTFLQFSPNMLKTFELCPKKFELKFVKNINMPVNDEIFEFGKNIHALASYYLKGENIDNMEKTLTVKELQVWNYLKSSEYFEYEVLNTEYFLNVKIGKYFFGGRIDALVKNDNTYFILDYKTGKIPANTKYDFQTIIYMLAVKEFLKTDNIKFVYMDLCKRESISIEYSKDLEIEHLNKLNNVVNKIELYESFPLKKDCKCEYKIICR